MARTWAVTLNLDEFNATYATFDDDDEIAAFTKGLNRGLNAGKLKDGAPAAMVLGFDLGLVWRQRAEDLIERKRAGGQASAASREAKNGASQPFSTVLEDSYGSASTVFEQSINQYPLPLNENPLPKNRSTDLATAPPKPKGGSRSLEVIKSASAREAFDRIWKKWPSTRPVDGGSCKGHKVEAENAFQKIVGGGTATPDELEAAVELYLTTYPNVLKGYIVNVSTFFGKQKGLWIESVRWIRAQAKVGA